MKKLSSTNKIVGVIIIAVILAGIIMVLTKGFYFGKEYSESKRIEIKIGSNVQIDDINQICKEVFEKNYTVQYIGEFNDSVAITVKDMSDEQKTNLQQKINEKYLQTSNEEENAEETKNIELVTIDVPSANIVDIIKSYIKPIIIATIIILIYMAIRYRELGIMHCLVLPFFAIVSIQAIYFSVIAITRIPVGILVMPIAIILYMISLILKNSK